MTTYDVQYAYDNPDTFRSSFLVISVEAAQCVMSEGSVFFYDAAGNVVGMVKNPLVVAEKGKYEITEG